MYSGTVVRNMMVNGDEWRPLVPKKVAEVIDYIDGVKRLRDISGGE